jgi:hypothetical protein
MTEGFNFVGLFRSDEGPIAALVIFIVLLVAARIVINKYAGLGSNEVRFVRRLARLIAAAAVFAYLMHFSGLLFSNRVPREVLDRTTTNKQMRDNQHQQ